MSIQDHEKFLREHVPMISYSDLSIAKLDPTVCIVKIPFIDKNKNHIQSMYFGSLMIGAEVSAGILTYDLIKRKAINSTVVFKDVKASFVKLAKNDVYFICQDGAIIEQSLEQTNTTHERVNFSVHVIGVEDLNNIDDKVTEVELTVSVKALPK